MRLPLVEGDASQLDQVFMNLCINAREAMPAGGKKSVNCLYLFITFLPDMIINQTKCVACGNCVAICPMGAIYVDQSKNRALINDDACVECGARPPGCCVFF